MPGRWGQRPRVATPSPSRTARPRAASPTWMTTATPPPRRGTRSRRWSPTGTGRMMWRWTATSRSWCPSATSRRHSRCWGGTKAFCSCRSRMPVSWPTNTKQRPRGSSTCPNSSSRSSTPWPRSWPMTWSRTSVQRPVRLARTNELRRYSRWVCETIFQIS